MLFDYWNQFIIPTKVSYSRRKIKFGRHPLSLSKVKNPTGALLGGFSRLLDSWSGLMVLVVVEGRWILQVRTTRE